MYATKINVNSAYQAPNSLYSSRAYIVGIKLNNDKDLISMYNSQAQWNNIQSESDIAWQVDNK